MTEHIDGTPEEIEKIAKKYGVEIREHPDFQALVGHLATPQHSLGRHSPKEEINRQFKSHLCALERGELLIRERPDGSIVVFTISSVPVKRKDIL